MIYKIINIPSYVSQWTDEYFHKSAFDFPIRFPNKKVIKFLSAFRKNEKVELYRGVNKYNEDNELISSWTYDKKIAKRYSLDGNGKVIKKEFYPNQILLDTTILTEEQKKYLGYDYKIDDHEVIVIKI